MDNCLFSWVHLSDLHFGHGNAAHGHDQRLVLAALQEDAKALLAKRHVPAPAVVLVSGDIAFSGACRSDSEYSDASRYLRKLAGALLLTDQHIFVVPGNHDVQRSVDTTDGAARELVAELRRGQQNLDQALQAEANRQLLLRRQSNFGNFAQQFAPACLEPSRPAHRLDVWMHRFVWGSLTVRLVGFNTALLAADSEDQGKLAIGLGAIEHAFLTPEIAAGELVIAMGHHPLQDGWLANQRNLAAWLQKYAAAYLSGHIHVQDSEDLRGGSGRSFVRVSAGAAHAEPGEFRHGYNFGAVLVSQSQKRLLRIWPRVWDDRGKRFVVDRFATPDGQDFAEHALGAPPEVPVRVPTRASLRRVFLRLLPTADEIHRFCQIHYPRVVAQLLNTPEPTAKVTLLFQNFSEADIVGKLRRFDSVRFAQHENLLEYAET